MVTAEKLPVTEISVKQRGRRIKTGLILKVPICHLGQSEFNELVKHNPMYTQVLLSYIREPEKLKKVIPEKGFDEYSLWDIQRYIHIWKFTSKKGNKSTVIAPNKKEAIKASRLPKHEILFLTRYNRNGKAFPIKRW